MALLSVQGTELMDQRGWQPAHLLTLIINSSLTPSLSLLSLYTPPGRAQRQGRLQSPLAWHRHTPVNGWLWLIQPRQHPPGLQNRTVPDPCQSWEARAPCSDRSTFQSNPIRDWSLGTSTWLAAEQTRRVQHRRCSYNKLNDFQFEPSCPCDTASLQLNWRRRGDSAVCSLGGGLGWEMLWWMDETASWK